MTRKQQMLGGVALIAIALLIACAGLWWIQHSRAGAVPSEASGASMAQEETSGGQADSADAVAQLTATAPQPATARTSDQVLIPTSVALVPGLKVTLANSWDEMLAGLSAEDEAKVRALSDRYPEAYQFRSKEQLQWMIERGYPMPEEILLAEKLGPDRLLEMAGQQNDKAADLAVDLLLRELAQLPEPNAVTDNPRAARIYQAQMGGSRNSCSPFKMLVRARHLEATGSAETHSRDLSPMIGALAAYQAAARLGDWRLENTAEVMGRSLVNSWSDARTLSSYVASTAAQIGGDCPTTNRFPRG